MRDAYDIDHAHRMDPAALETAVNSLTPEHIRRAEIVYASQSGRMDQDQNAILDWTRRPAGDQQGCGLRAGQIIHDARWIEVEITARHGRIQATTTSTAGIRRDQLGPTGISPKEAAGRLAEEGILDHLLHHYKTADWTMRDVVDRITKHTRNDERIMRIAPGEGHGADTARATFTARSPLEPPRIGGSRETLNVIRGEESGPGGAEPDTEEHGLDRT